MDESIHGRLFAFISGLVTWLMWAVVSIHGYPFSKWQLFGFSKQEHHGKQHSSYPFCFPLPLPNFPNIKSASRSKQYILLPRQLMKNVFLWEEAVILVFATQTDLQLSAATITLHSQLAHKPVTCLECQYLHFLYLV